MRENSLFRQSESLLSGQEVIKRFAKREYGSFISFHGNRFEQLVKGEIIEIVSERSEQRSYFVLGS